MDAAMRGTRRHLVEGPDRPHWHQRAGRVVFAMLAGREGCGRNQTVDPQPMRGGPMAAMESHD